MDKYLYRLITKNYNNSEIRGFLKYIKIGKLFGYLIVKRRIAMSNIIIESKYQQTIAGKQEIIQMIVNASFVNIKKNAADIKKMTIKQ